MSTTTVSACCGAEAEVMDGKEGTSWFLCTKCARPCDPAPTNPPTETVSDCKNKEEIMNNGGMSKECLVHIYPVGFYRDVNEYLLKRWEPKVFTRWFLSSWNRKSYWNGFLCEPLTMPKHMTKCGKGITQGMAFRNYEKMQRTHND